MERALAIANPRVAALRGGERRASVERAVADAVRARVGAELEWEAGDRAAVDRALVDAVARRAPLVVVVGGDGTIRLAAQRLAGTGIPLAVVPSGTGNLLAATLRIPAGREAALRVLTGGVEADVDAGEVAWTLAGSTTTGSGAGAAASRTGRGVFVVACGSGFDARVMAAAGEATKRTVGRAAYFAAAATLVPGITARPHRIDVDGEIHEIDAFAVFVANAGEVIPGLVRPRLAIRADDGLLDVLAILGRGVVRGVVGALELLARTEPGRSATGSSLRLQGRRVAVSSEPPEVIEVDGDVLGQGSFVAEVLPAALRVIVPRV